MTPHFKMTILKSAAAPTRRRVAMAAMELGRHVSQTYAPLAGLPDIDSGRACTYEAHAKAQLRTVLATAAGMSTNWQLAPAALAAHTDGGAS